MKSRVLHGVFSRLAASFSAPAQAVGDAARKPAPAALTSPPENQLNGEAFGARVGETVRRRQAGAAGKFQVVRLDRVQDTLGHRWPAIQERVMQVAERVLQKRLTRVDCFSRADDRSFLVLFVELSEEQARFKAKSIADEILSIVCGEVDNAVEKSGEAVISLCTGVAGVDRLTLSVPVSVAELSLALDDEIGRENPATEVNARSLIGDADLEFRPTLNVRTGYVAIFESFPIRRSGGREHRGVAFYPGGNGEQNLRMNIDIVRRAIDCVHEARAAGRKFRAVLPIHFDAIASRYRHDLIDVLKTLDQETRDAFVFDIVGCPAGTPSVRLSEVISALTPFGKAMTMRVALDHPYIDALANLGLTALGTDLDEREIEGGTMSALTAFVRRTRMINLQPFVFGLRSADMIAPLAALGVEYINGPAVSPAMRRVGALERYPHSLPPARPVLDLVPAAGAVRSSL